VQKKNTVIRIGDQPKKNIQKSENKRVIRLAVANGGRGGKKVGVCVLGPLGQGEKSHKVKKRVSLKVSD